MAIFRVQKTDNYTVMANHHFQNTEMSWKAKGILSQILSLPDDWDYTEDGLTVMSCDGKDSLRKGLEELERFGYLRRVKVRDARGIFTGIRYDVFEKPVIEPSYPSLDFPKTEKPKTENPSPEKPKTENPFLENPPQQNTNKQNTKSTITRARTIPPTHEEVCAFFGEIGGSDAMAEEYMDHYQANGWKVGKTPMKDWKASARNWMRREKEFRTGTKGAPEERQYSQTELRAMVNDPLRDYMEGMR